MIGPSPRYMPRTPSSLQIILAVPSIPRYTTCAGSWLAPCRPWNPPCACNLVLITSSGHVTTPEANPPTAPARALKVESDFPTQNASRSVRGPCCTANAACGFPNWGEVDVDGEYSSVPEEDGVLRSCDIVMMTGLEGELHRPRLNHRQRSSRTLLCQKASFLSSQVVSRGCGECPTQHARDTATSDCHRPLTAAAQSQVVI